MYEYDYASQTSEQGLLMLAALLPVFLWCYLLICMLQTAVFRKETAAAAIGAVLSYLFYVTLRIHVEEITPLAAAVGFLAQGAALARLARQLFIQKRTHLSAMSIKEGFDTLPAGLCFYQPGGMPRMVNLRMDSLYLQITGEHLSNAEEFYDQLTAGAYPCSISGGEQPMICLPDGTAYSFSHSIITMRGSSVHELIAADITKRYAITQDLAEKQKHIRQINTRLKALNTTMRYVIMEKELLHIKTQVHDELGQALLLSRLYLQEPGQVDAAQMLSQWKNSFGLLLHEERETWQKPYLVNTRQAEMLGIRLEICGKLPEEEHLIPVIDTAIRVHTTNVMRHAEGTHAVIRIEETPQTYLLHFTNDGRQPQDTVRETGGLSNLRRMTEHIGGRMEISSQPQFTLTLELPRNRTEGTI